MTHIRTIAGAAIIFASLAGCDEKEIVIPHENIQKNFVEFRAGKYEVNENISSTEIRLRISPAAIKAGEIVLKSDEAFANVFITNPAPVNGTIRVPVAVGDSVALINLQPVDNTMRGGDQVRTLYISSTSPDLLTGMKSTTQIVIKDDEGDGSDQDDAMTLFDDDIYMFEGGNPEGVRLDPLVNDRITGSVSVTYTQPVSGTIEYIENEGWFYKPDNNFTGTDEFTYSACAGNVCKSATIRLHVEEQYGENCIWEVNNETVETQRGTPVAIRIFLNDRACVYRGSNAMSPLKGTFDTYSYSGSFKNIVYVYYPPAGFTGTDTFKYSLTTDTGVLEGQCTVIVR